VSAPVVRIRARLRPVLAAVGLQGFMLWVPVEKLFETQIGFDAATIGVLAAAYSLVTPLLEVPSGILADRSSRSRLLMAAGVALAVSTLLGGLSTGVGGYIAASLVLGAYFALQSGTVDSIVYDTVLEETGSSELYERVVGRVRVVESAALATSALAGGVLAELTSPRTTYLVSVPFGVLAVLALVRFREPQLHRGAERTSLREHVATTFRAMTRIPRVRAVVLLAALGGMLSQAVFEFGPLWLTAADAPAALYGPYWAGLVATLGAGGFLAARLRLERRGAGLAAAAAVLVSALALALGGGLAVAIAAQILVCLLLAALAVHIGRVLHDAVPSSIRAGVSSGVGTLTWVLFLPFSLVLGAVAVGAGMAAAGWLLAGAAAVLALLLAVATRRRGPAHAAEFACRDLVAKVTAYLDGALPGADGRTVEEHLAGCPGCAAYLDQIRATVARLGRLDVDGDATVASDV
jgi:predicted MFS family arabinose efflux permease